MKAAGGRLGGPPPYGWRAHRGQLIPVPDEQAPRWLILHLHRQGWTLQRITDALYGLRIPPRAGKPGDRWTRGAVHKVTRSAADLQDTG